MNSTCPRGFLHNTLVNKTNEYMGLQWALHNGTDYAETPNGTARLFKVH